MSRAKSSKHQKSSNSVLSQDYKSYFGSAQPINQLSLDVQSSTSNNDPHLISQNPSGYNLLELPSNDMAKNSKKSSKKHRKRSFNEPSNALVIKQVDEDLNNSKQELTGAPQRLKSQFNNDKNVLARNSQNYPSENVLKKPNFIIEMEDAEPSTVDPSAQISTVNRYSPKKQQNKERTSQNSRSSKITNPNIVVISLSDPIEERKLQAYKRSIINTTSANEGSLNQGIKLDYLTKCIPRRQTIEYNFTREQRCCHNFTNPQYALNFQSGGFLLNAQKQFGYFNSCYYITATKNNYQNKGQTYMGYLKGNFTGSEFNLYQIQGDKEEITATIYYEGGFKCSSYRKMEVYIKNPTLKEPLSEGKASLRQLYSSVENNTNKNIIKLVTKEPKYNKKHDCFIMNFKGKSKFASIKNMVLVEEDNPQDYILMFCKTDKHEYHLQASSPLSPLMAFGVVLSGFDFKLCSQ